MSDTRFCAAVVRQATRYEPEEMCEEVAEDDREYCPRHGDDDEPDWESIAEMQAESRAERGYADYL